MIPGLIIQRTRRISSCIVKWTTLDKLATSDTGVSIEIERQIDSCWRSQQMSGNVLVVFFGAYEKAMSDHVDQIKDMIRRLGLVPLE